MGYLLFILLLFVFLGIDFVAHHASHHPPGR